MKDYMIKEREGYTEGMDEQMDGWRDSQVLLDGYCFDGYMMEQCKD